MGNRLTKIYTRTGDDGSTGLGDGARVAKESARVEAYGTVDEANSAIGVVLAVARGFHSPGRRPRRCRLSCSARRLPEGRTALLVPGSRRGRGAGRS